RTNSANWLLVTWVRSIQNPCTRTGCAGCSLGCASLLSLPMRNSPGGTHPMPAGVDTPSPTMTWGGCAGPESDSARAIHAMPAPANAPPRTATPPNSAARRSLVNAIRTIAGLAQIVLDHAFVERVGQTVHDAVDHEIVHARQTPGLRNAAPFGEVLGVDHTIAVAVARAIGLRGKQRFHLAAQVVVDAQRVGVGRLREQAAIARVEQRHRGRLIDLEELIGTLQLEAVGLGYVDHRFVAHKLVALVAHGNRAFRNDAQDRHAVLVPDLVDLAAGLVAYAAVGHHIGIGVVAGTPPDALIV